METTESLRYDKTCRICGIADLANVSIFKDQTLPTKISTVYPILLLEDDPLPKNICKKCVSHVQTTYNDIQRVVKLQNKWTQNIQSTEPHNSFLQILNLLEHSTEAIKSRMIETFGANISKEAIKRKLTNALSDMKKEGCCYSGIEPMDVSPTINGGEKPSQAETQIKEEQFNNGDDGDEEDEENVALSKILEISHKPNNSGKLICCRFCSLQFESLPRLALHQNTHLKLRLPKLFQKKLLSKKARRGRLITVKDRQNIRCLNCLRIFNDNKCILDHWSSGDCEFYCLICGEEFEQSPKLLREHIYMVHGGVSYKSVKGVRNRFTKKIASPKKHKQQRTNNGNVKCPTENKDNSDLLAQNKLNATQITSENLTQTTSADHSASNAAKDLSPNSNKFVVCRICSRTFSNFNGCNSHMRTHKAQGIKIANLQYEDNDIEEPFPGFESIDTEMRKSSPAYQIPTTTTKPNVVISNEIFPRAVKTEPPTSVQTFAIGHYNVPEAPKIYHQVFSSDIRIQNQQSLLSSEFKAHYHQQSLALADDKTHHHHQQIPGPYIKPHQQNFCCSADVRTQSLQSLSCSVDKTPSDDVKTNTSASTSSQPPTPTKNPTSTAPRGIRMKFVTRRSDLNGMPPSIKVKSLSDLKRGQHPLIVPNQSPVLDKVQNIIPTTTTASENSSNASIVNPNITNQSIVKNEI